MPLKPVGRCTSGASGLSVPGNSHRLRDVVQKFHEVRHAERVEVTKKSVRETPIGLTPVRQTKKRHPLASSASLIVLVLVVVLVLGLW
jgi:hypothetical protein